MKLWKYIVAIIILVSVWTPVRADESVADSTATDAVHLDGTFSLLRKLSMALNMMDSTSRKRVGKSSRKTLQVKRSDHSTCL